MSWAVGGEGRRKGPAVPLSHLRVRVEQQHQQEHPQESERHVCLGWWGHQQAVIEGGLRERMVIPLSHRWRRLMPLRVLWTRTGSRQTQTKLAARAAAACRPSPERR